MIRLLDLRCYILNVERSQRIKFGVREKIRHRLILFGRYQWNYYGIVISFMLLTTTQEHEQIQMNERCRSFNNHLSTSILVNFLGIGSLARACHGNKWTYRSTHGEHGKRGGE